MERLERIIMADVLDKLHTKGSTKVDVLDEPTHKRKARGSTLWRKIFTKIEAHKRCLECLAVGLRI